MEAALRLLTKEALRDQNFGQTFFDNGLPDDEGVMKEADLAKTTRKVPNKKTIFKKKKPPIIFKVSPKFLVLLLSTNDLEP